MRLCFYELKKMLSGRLMPIIIAALILVNGILCFIFIKSKPELEYLDDLKSVDEVNKKDPEQIRTIYETYEKEYEKYENDFKDWINSRFGPNADKRQNEVPEKPAVPHNFSDKLDDYEIIKKYYENIVKNDDYKETNKFKLNDLIRSIKNYLENGYEKNSFSYRYQICMIEKTQNAIKKVNLSENLVYGWDILFSYSGTYLFMILAAIFIGGRMFMLEKDSGMHLVLRTMQKGRAKTVFFKLIAAFALILIISLLLVFITFLIIGFSVGFSSPFSAIQEIGAFDSSTYILNTLTCFILTFLLMLAGAYTVCIITGFFSVSIRNGALSMIISAAFVGISYVVSVFAQNQNFFRLTNLITVSSAEKLFSLWTPVHFFGHPIADTLTIPIYFASLIAIFTLLTYMVWTKFGIGVGTTKKSILKRISEIIHASCHSNGQIFYEAKKIFRTKVIVIAVLIIALKIISSFTTINGEIYYDDEIRKSIIDNYSDLSLEETYDAVCEKCDYYAEISTDSYANMMAVKRKDGSITQAEYREYREELNDAKNMLDYYKDYQKDLINLVEKSEEIGISSKPSFDVGYMKLFSMDFEYLLVILLVFLLCDVFAREYETDFIRLLRSTGNGQRKAFWAKIRLTCLLSGMLALIFNAFDILLVFAKYDMTCIDSPLFTIKSYLSLQCGITIGNYILLVAIIRIITYMIFGLITVCVSCITRSEWLTVAVFVMMFIPYMLSLLGINIMSYFDISTLLSVDRLLLLCLKSGGLIKAIVIALSWIAVLTGAMIYSYIEFCKSAYKSR